MDNVYVKGFRTQAAYFVEKTTYGRYSISNTKARRIGGKVRGVNWSVRQNIIQTGSIGQGRNYTQQLYGQYDASASLNFEVIDFSFLRFGVGDIAKYDAAGGSTEAAPYFLLEAELTGLDGTTTTNDSLSGASTIAYSTVRLRPFSMILYDMENTLEGDTFNDNVDILKGCMIDNFSISATVGSPVTCSVNMIVREIDYRRYLATAELPDFTNDTASDDDIGNCDYELTSTPSYGTPLETQTIANYPPLMFYNGSLKIANESTDDGDENVLGQVTSFNYSYSNSLITYRTLGSRFINLPQIGMRRQTLSCNVIMNIPSGTGAPDTESNTTTVLELIKNYLGYASDAAFATTQTLAPALATTSSTTSPQSVVPIEKYNVQLHMEGPNTDGNTRGANINVRYAAIEGFGVPIILENGLIEVPINFSVRGLKYLKTGDGSYNGRLDTTTASYLGIAPIFEWWF
jgi:hypothetical protein